MSPQEQLRSLLPAGEWSEIKLVSDPGGMMADQAGAIHATARHLRFGGSDAYLKLLPSRGESAGERTKRFAGATRLERVCQRLQRAMRSEELPLAPLLEVRYLDAWPGLLIAMKQVQPIHMELQAGKLSVPLAVEVLSRLGSDKCGDWIHYDICPKNTGLLTDRSSVFIDPESLYLADDVRLDVSLPAFKFHRTPTELADECQNNAIDGSLTVQMARKKHDAELLVLGAECCLGLFGLNFSSTAVDRWCDSAQADPALVEFWRQELHQLASGDVANPSEIAAALQEHQARRTRTTAESHVVPLQRSDLKLEEVSRWDEFEESRLALRRDMLARNELREYRERMLKLGRKNGSDDRRWWDEVLLIALAYEKNPRIAEILASEALRLFPSDPDFTRKHQLARMWSQ